MMWWASHQAGFLSQPRWVQCLSRATSAFHWAAETLRVARPTSRTCDAPFMRMRLKVQSQQQHSDRCVGEPADVFDLTASFGDEPRLGAFEVFDVFHEVHVRSDTAGGADFAVFEGTAHDVGRGVVATLCDRAGFVGEPVAFDFGVDRVHPDLAGEVVVDAVAEHDAVHGW